MAYTPRHQLNPFPGPVDGQDLPTVIFTIRGQDNTIAAMYNAHDADGTIHLSGGATVGTLTFGTHLTGGSFNGSANVTIATDATSNNTINTIVARDGSGNFSANIITGTNATTAQMQLIATGIGSAKFSYLTNSSLRWKVGVNSGNTDLWFENTAGGVAALLTQAGKFSAVTLDGTLVTAAQPNVTSVGTLTGLGVSGGISTTGSLTFGGGAATLYNVISVTGTTTAAAYQRMSNTGADCIFGIERSTGGILLTGSTAYAGIVTMVGNTPLQFGSNNTLAISMLGNAVTMPGTLAVTGVLTGSADIKLATVGSGYYAKEGTNATMGVATLSTGTVVVATTKVTASSRIFVSRQDDPSALGVLPCDVTARVVGTSFTIKSSNPLDNATVAWIIFEPS